MRRFEKFLCVITAVCILLCLFGCQRPEEPETPQVVAPPLEDDPQPEPQPEPEHIPEPEPEPTPAPTPAPDSGKDDTAEQLGRIEAKLDKLLGLVNPSLLEG